MLRILLDIDEELRMERRRRIAQEARMDPEDIPLENMPRMVYPYMIEMGKMYYMSELPYGGRDDTEEKLTKMAHSIEEAMKQAIETVSYRWFTDEEILNAIDAEQELEIAGTLLR